MAGASMDLQFQIRQNTMEMNDFLADLGDWTSEVQGKDDALKQGKAVHGAVPAAAVPAPAPAPRGRVRNTVKEPPTTGGLGEKTAAKREKARAAEAEAKANASAAGHTYDYFRDKWDKFDVDAALEEVDNDSEDEGAKKNHRAPGSVPRGPGDIAPNQVFEQPVPAEREIDPEEEKEKGNALYKKGDYGGAIVCYSQSIDAEKSAVAYANRAMALLKQAKYEQAEEDCTAALQLDPEYIKALSRRGTARRHLGKYLDSTLDFEMTVRLEPTSSLHTKERAGSRAMLQEAEKLCLTHPRTLLPVEEVAPPPSSASPPPSPPPTAAESSTAAPTVAPSSIRPAVSSPSHPAHAANAAAGSTATPTDTNNGEQVVTPVAERKKVMELAHSAAAKLEAKQVERARSAAVSSPRSGLEFERSWNVLSNDTTAQLNLLKALDPAQLSGVFKESLSVAILIKVLHRALDALGEGGDGTSPADREFLVALLEGFVCVPRFDMNVMFLAGKDKKEAQRLWDVAAGAGLNGHVAERLTTMRKKYRL